MNMQNFHQRFLWRVTGFPIDLLEQFALADLAEDVRGWFSGGSAAGNWADTWQRIRSGREESGAERQFDQAFYRLRRQLGRVAGEARFQLAVGCSSPQAAAILARLEDPPSENRRSKEKRRELLAMRYLQRFTTKCETTAFFGGVATGRFADVPGMVDYRYDISAYRGQAFLGERFLQSLIRRLRRRIGILNRLRVRRSTGMMLRRDGSVLHPRRGLIRLTALEHRLLTLAAGQRIEKIIARIEPPERHAAYVSLFNLLDAGLLIDDLDLAANAASPVGYLQRLLAAIHTAAGPVPEEIFQLLQLLDSAIRQWPGAGARCRGEIFERIHQQSRHAGLPALDGKGHFFSDHQPLIEEGYCHGSHLHLDWNWAGPSLSDLEAVLRAGVGAARQRRSAQQRALAGMLPLARGRENQLPLAALVEKMAAPGSRPGAAESAADSHPLVISPDIMIAAANLEDLRRGNGEWILSDCHTSIGCAGFFTRVMPDADAWLSDYAAFLGRQFTAAELMIVTSRIWNKTFRVGQLPGAVYLENEAPAPEDVETVDLDDLAVADTGNGWQLVRRSTAKPVVLLPANPFSDDEPLNLLGVPRYRSIWESAGGSRRYEGSIMVNRATWQLALPDLPPPSADPFECFAWAQCLRSRQGLPRWVFVKNGEDRKPSCIDFSNPFLCEEFLRLARSGELTVSEMYPAPEQAWVRGVNGERYLNEMRLQFAAAD